MGFLSHSLSTRLIAIRSVNRTLQEINPKGWCAVRTLHIAIALVIHSLDRSLFIRLIAVAIRSVDRTLQTTNYKLYFSHRL